MTSPSPWTPLHARLHQTLRQRQLVTRRQRLLIAVSGGQDSLALLQLCLDLQSRWGWTLAIAHCDHGWRADSLACARYVESLATTHHLPFYLAKATHLSETEGAARQWRYQQLQAIAAQHDSSALLTGHTASDRAETLLYNLVRGSGADGMQSLPWRRSLTPRLELIRPLLQVTRQETAQFCQDRGLQIWEDPSNQDLHYARNRIRQELLPYLTAHFNPQAEPHLAQTAELLQAEVEYLESVAAEVLERSLQSFPAEMDRATASLDRTILQTVPRAIQRRVMRQFLQRHLPTMPGFQDIEKLTDLITAPNRTQTDPFTGGAIARTQDNHIDWQPRIPSQEP